jgi:SAM-dependent methyltransferase
MLDVSSYYDELHRWTHKDKDFQAFSGVESDAIHRFLVNEETGQFSPDTIYNFIDPFIPPNGQTRGLDAGCGYGGACFRNVKVHGGEWTGLTISQEQWQRAKWLASSRGLQDSLQFYLRSYDEALSARYNIILGIESLIHSADPAHTVANLAASLDRGGRLVIIDDMPVTPLDGEDLRLFDEFRKCWRCPRAPSAEEWAIHAGSAGLRLTAAIDLTHLMRPRSEKDLDAALVDLTSQREAKTASGFARLSDAEIGGLHLERLHGRGKMRYKMLVFEH